MKTTYYWV